MNRSYRIIPVYTGDVSGIASALFELGGMVVIHDPSGCNSTYNTHDETRWYDYDSLIFISGLSQTDAIMGDDEKFIREIEEAAMQLSPKFIAITSSPIPYMNGTDFPAIARLLARDTGIPAFFVRANGMHDYVKGAGEAFLQIARNLLPAAGIQSEEKTSFQNHPVLAQKKLPGINLLGVTPLDFCGDHAVEALIRSCGEHGFFICSCWAMGDTLEKLQRAPEADANLVVSAAGLAAAEYLYEKYRIPYTVGRPVGRFTGLLFEELRKTIEDGENRIPYQTGQNTDPHGKEAVIYAIGEPVSLGSLAAAVYLETGKKVRVLCPLEADGKLLGENAEFTEGEEEAEKALASAEAVIADPLYRPICRKDVKFYALPHQAFSGRCFCRSFKSMPQLLEEIRRDFGCGGKSTGEMEETYGP